MGRSGGKRGSGTRVGGRVVEGHTAERDRAVLAAALDPIVTIDAGGVVQSASDSVERVLGWSPADLVGRNVSVLMPEPYRSAHDGYLAKYQQTGLTNIMNRPRRFEAVRKNGTRLPIELCVSRAEVSGGPPLFVGIIRDISEFVAAERSQEEERVRSERLLAEQTTALHTAHARLRMADRMASIGTLAAGLGHDMNNVLLPVRARLNALRAAGERGRLGTAEREHVDEVRKSVAYLQQLADGLHFLALDPEAEAAARGGGERSVTDLHEWWGQTGVLLSKSVPRHVRVSASIPRGLPRVAVAVHGLTQAVLNLVVNSGEAIPPPSQRKRRQGMVHIRAAVEEDGGAGGRRWVRLSVEDNGSGMSEEVRRRAFEMFFTTKPRGLGTGLGLALVHKVVDQAGGRVEIESGVGRGTTVMLMLPAVRSARGPGAAARGGRPSDGERGPAVAVVRVSDGRAAGLIRHMLECAGLRVETEATEGARVWVTDSGAREFERVRAWVERGAPGNMERRVVVLGRTNGPNAARWRGLGPVTIENPGDFQAVRSAIGRVLVGVEGWGE
ncbi:MAG: PAS domain S-box protein [Phycisphaerales bacterium]|nr:PAS domain S-box protein [Phycisphaerales bacterium]